MATDKTTRAGATNSPKDHPVVVGILVLAAAATIYTAVDDWLKKRPLPQTMFTIEDMVRCPGGGDVFGRERNRRSKTVTYQAPAGGWIVTGPTGPRVDVLADNDGSMGQLDFTHHDSAGRPTNVSVRITCDPPNYPGAGGGWMRIKLSGFVESASR